MLNYCAAGARLVDTASMTLDEIEAECVAAHAAGQDVARLHSGDLSVFSAVAEQIRRLKRRGIPYTSDSRRAGFRCGCRAARPRAHRARGRPERRVDQGAGAGAPMPAAEELRFVQPAATCVIWRSKPSTGSSAS